MALHACLINNKVDLIVELATDEDISKMAQVYSNVINIQDEVVRPNVGWYLQGLEWVPGEVEAPHSLRPISPRQIRLGLIGAGVSLPQIDATIETLEEPTKSYAKIAWEYAVEFHRDDALVGMFAQMLGMTDAQVDALWIQAGAL